MRFFSEADLFGEKTPKHRESSSETLRGSILINQKSGILVSLPSATPKCSVLCIRSVGHIPCSANVLSLTTSSENLTDTTFLLVSGTLEDSGFE